MIASWFLAAEKGNALVESWRQSVTEYWKGRAQRHDYFWFHHLFADQYEADREFRRLWDDTPKVSAVHGGHFGPLQPALMEALTSEGAELIKNPPAPVFKLTHKLLAEKQPNALIDHLFDWGLGRATQPKLPTAPHHRARILIAWYGSFDGHGTVGDQLSMEAVVTHLVARGHSVSHASADKIEIAGAVQVPWSEADAASFDAVIFVCGPILNFHFLTNSLFERFKEVRLAGAGVSLMPPGDPSFSNPFEFVLAREGLDRVFGDLAIVGPRSSQDQTNQRVDVGVVLRGDQQEYGPDRCQSRETELLTNGLAAFAAAQTGGQVIHIENHLRRSGLKAGEIEAVYDRCSLIVTSRFHGAIAALRHNVPFIAIDQIEGGAKVKALLEKLPWPYAYSIDDASPSKLEAACLSILSGADETALGEARHAAVREANRTLLALDEWLASIT